MEHGNRYSIPIDSIESNRWTTWTNWLGAIRISIALSLADTSSGIQTCEFRKREIEGENYERSILW